jgi:hypothetical protein
MSNPNHDPKTGEFSSGSSGHNAGGGNRAVANQIAAEHKKPVGYHIVDGQTNKIVAKAKTSMGANKSVDRRDNAYGGYRHRRVPIYDKEKF